MTRIRSRRFPADAPLPVHRAPRPRARARVLGCELDRVTMAGALRRVAVAVDTDSYCQHMAINAAKLVALRRDADLRKVVSGCRLVTADGQAVVWASRLLGDSVPERVTGIDLMEAVLDRAEERGWRVYILGARREVLTAAVERIQARHPGLRIVGWRDGYFDAIEEAAVAESIRRTGAQLLFVAISSPRKERFLGAYGRATGANFTMGVGGAIDVVAGRCRRAPLRWQQMGLEWLFRLLQEPHRLVRRYATTNLRFMLLVAHELAAQRARRAVVGWHAPLVLQRSGRTRSRG